MAEEKLAPSAERTRESEEGAREAVRALDRTAERDIKQRTRTRLDTMRLPDGTPPPPSDPPPEDAIENIPQNAKPLMRRLKLERKKDKNKDLIDRELLTNAAIARHLQQLRDELKELKRVEDFSERPNAYFGRIFGKIDAMLAQSQTDGLVVRQGGRLTNRIGYVSPWIAELDDMLLGEKDPATGNRQGSLFQIMEKGSEGQLELQKNFILKVKKFFQEVRNGDRKWADVYDKAIKEVLPQSHAMRKGKDAIKMLGLLMVGGIATFAGLMDFKAGTLSPYTLAWLGLTGYMGGFFNENDRVVRSQLTFVTTSKWERLRRTLPLKGQEGVEFITAIRKAHKDKKGEALKLLTEGQRAKRVPKAEYIRAIVGENPQGQDAFMAQLLNKLSKHQLYLLGSSINDMTDPTAVAIFHDFIENDVHSGSVAREVRAMRQKNPPSASAPSGTPQGNPPQG